MFAFTTALLLNDIWYNYHRLSIVPTSFIILFVLFNFCFVKIFHFFFYWIKDFLLKLRKKCQEQEMEMVVHTENRMKKM